MSDNSQESAKDTSQKVAGILDAHRGERHVVVLHDYPDPDVIASACAHQLISSQFEIEVDIAYAGKISHQQNVAMVRLLGIDLIQYNDSLDFEQYDGAVFVDSQGTNSEKIVQALENAKIPVVLIIDHHDRQNRLEAEFTDIRRTGSTATIYTEYLEQGLLELNTSRKEHVVVATALMLGIMTDTGGFTQANAEDFRAAAFLSRFREADLLGQIMRQSRSKQVMEIIRRSLGNRITAESYSIAGIGYLRADDRDAIPQAADFLLTEENVHTALVYGIVTDDDQVEMLTGSLRTSKITLDPDAFLKDLLGKNETGQYMGGGKDLAGGFEIPIGFLSGEYSEEYQSLKWQVYDKQVKQKIFDKIGVQQEQRTSG